MFAIDSYLEPLEPITKSCSVMDIGGRAASQRRVRRQGRNLARVSTRTYGKNPSQQPDRLLKNRTAPYTGLRENSGKGFLCPELTIPGCTRFKSIRIETL